MHGNASATILLAAAGLAQACSPRSAEIVAEERILARQLDGLRALIARSRSGPLLAPDQIQIAVHEEWVQEVLQLELPRTQVVAERYRVAVETVQVSFRDGLGLVRLGGRVSFASRPGDRVYADLAVYGAVDVVELDSGSGVLRARITPIAFEVQSVSVLFRSPLGRELAEALGRERLDSFAALARELEIPVRLEQRVELPGLGPGGPVEFEGAAVPIALAVSRVTALDGRLWISVDASVAEPGEAG